MVVVASIIPSIFISSSLPNYDQQISKFTWISQNTEEDSTILAPIEFGNLLTYVGERKNVLDDNFLLAPNVEERVDDVDLLYKTVFEVKGLEVLNKYNINYILVTPVMKHGLVWNVEEEGVLFLLKYDDGFAKIYDEAIEVWEYKPKQKNI